MLVHQVDALGQQPSFNLYIQVTLCYHVHDDSANGIGSVVAALNDGLKRLATLVPWTAGEVLVEGNPPLLIIKPTAEIPTVVVKDLRNDKTAPLWQTLENSEFPMSLMDENMLCPRNTFPGTPGEPSSRPTFLVQATLVKGGLLLSFVGHHQVMDMVGQDVVMDLLNRACHHEEIPGTDLDSANVARERIIPLLDVSQKTGLEDQFTAPAVPVSDTPAAPVAPPLPPTASWVYFSFDRASLTSLKAVASETKISDFVSTDDSLCALIWQSIMRARSARLAATDNVIFSRFVDMRGALGMEPKYPGMVLNTSNTILEIGQIVSEPLGVIASRLRGSLDRKRLGEETIALATLLHRTEDKSVIQTWSLLNFSADMMLSSWSKIDGCWQMDFNMGLGQPVAVRRPRFVPFGTLVNLMPKSPSGEVSAAICLIDEDMDRLKSDKEFLKYGRYIG
ncbi:trichothecene 3-O-acetyltransferase [Entomortierella parvispora]|uniref:Trichothecene 3-O-acetyltransferase n=1 Tax=Entomortierella parvispora TaxID=205924 RepID=A0A9P3HDY5_9FUNG|nr:trichothecene 3-O-acetyltransferase [Entomortierella parvispora]